MGSTVWNKVEDRVEGKLVDLVQDNVEDKVGDEVEPGGSKMGDNWEIKHKTR